MPQALIFDCDGTLADTMPLHWIAWQQITSRHGLHFPEERFYAYGGVPTRDILKILSAEQGVTIDPLLVAKEKEMAYRAVMHRVQPIAETIEIVRAHHGKLPMAVASGGLQGVITDVLELIGIRDLMDAVVTSEMVQRQKPAPDIFLEAARRLGVEPRHCRGYEDTDLGIEAVRAAGMEAVDVRHLRDVAQLSPAALGRV